MRVIAVPCHMDNYSWIIYSDIYRKALIVDPCEGIPLLRELDRLKALPVAVCCTHHHADHIDGLPELLEMWPRLPVFCHISDLDRISRATTGLEDGDSVDFCDRQGKVVHTPGHTLGSICYHFGDYLFTGDTLFGAGCGRMFEGEPAQMAASLKQIARLPQKTKICFGHEYTAANLKFAIFAEPDNNDILVRQQQVAVLREKGQITAPSSLAEELRTNPFLRCDNPLLATCAKQRFGAANREESEVFRALRQAKDNF